jgi:chromosomal replication initiation ATPase DnaA
MTEMKPEYALLFIREIDIPMIKKDVSELLRVPLEVMDMKTRKREVVTARQVSMTLAKHFTNYSLAKIGTEIGGKDHATVLHACKTVNNLIDTKDPVVTNAMKRLMVKYTKIQEEIKRKPDPLEVQEATIFNTEK